MINNRNSEINRIIDQKYFSDRLNLEQFENKIKEETINTKHKPKEYVINEIENNIEILHSKILNKKVEKTNSILNQQTPINKI